jgi:phage terminase large subunit-like protein
MEQDNKWHVGKEIPLAVLFTLMIQTGGGIWWLAQVSSKIDYAVATLQTFQAERYTREDARRDKEIMVQMIETQRQRDIEHDRRLVEIENRVAGRGLK